MPVDWRKLVGEARPFSYAAAVCAVAVAMCLELFLSKLTGAVPSTTLFAVSIAVSAWFGGAGPGILALLLSAASIDYLVYEPGTFSTSPISARCCCSSATSLAGWDSAC